jgi:hypothetical protein
MKVALVTTGPGLPSGIGDYTRHLSPHLARECDLSVFVPADQAGQGEAGMIHRPLDELRPKEYEHILYQLGNETGHAFMVPLIQAWGGTVVLHDWVLFDMATAAFPGLARGGWKGHLLALREGGLHQGAIYARNRRERRRLRAGRGPAAGSQAGYDKQNALTHGWHKSENGGRWSGPCAGLALPSPGVRRIVLSVAATAGRSLRVGGPTGPFAEFPRNEIVPGKDLLVELPAAGTTTILLETTVAKLTAEQKANGDTRLLGTFFTAIACEDEAGLHPLDLHGPAAPAPYDHPLTLDRFRLPLNRSVVRHADSFLAHSDHVCQLIREERNAMTPLGRVLHGAHTGWTDQSRRETRAALGLGDEWMEATLFICFGALQRHKRIDKVLAAFAEARRQRADLRLVLAGAPHPEDLDVESLVSSAGLAESVLVTGYLAEEEIGVWIDAADVCVNLRGPSTGGTSGGLHRCLGRGRVVIASDIDEQAELPDSCVIKIASGPDEVQSLARVMLEVAGDPERRKLLESAARTFVEEHCQWSRVAQRYIKCLEVFPRPRVCRVSLIRSAVAAADRGA